MIADVVGIAGPAGIHIFPDNGIREKDDGFSRQNAGYRYPSQVRDNAVIRRKLLRREISAPVLYGDHLDLFAVNGKRKSAVCLIGLRRKECRDEIFARVLWRGGKQLVAGIQDPVAVHIAVIPIFDRISLGLGKTSSDILLGIISCDHPHIALNRRIGRIGDPIFLLDGISCGGGYAFNGQRILRCPIPLVILTVLGAFRQILALFDRASRAFLQRFDDSVSICLDLLLRQFIFGLGFGQRHIQDLIRISGIILRNQCDFSVFSGNIEIIKARRDI